MGHREDERRRRARINQVRMRFGQELVRLRQDAGLTARAVAAAAGISPSHLCAIERGQAEASTSIQVAIADVLGADLSIRAYPNTGPRIHDAIQARIVEELIHARDPRWSAFVEVPVTRPARGYLDLVFAQSQPSLLVASEVESDIHRLEQQVRWAQDKANSLPSSEIWQRFDHPTVSRLLVLRSTAHTREVAIRFGETLIRAYPAAPTSIHAAITGNAPWPGPGILWVRVDGDRVTLLDRAPRGIKAWPSP